MNKDLETQLAFASKLEADEDCDLFFDILQKMALSKDNKYIMMMLSYLKDDFNTYNDVMSTIVGMAETFPAHDYVKAVIQSVHSLRTKAVDWLGYIHSGIFNHEEYAQIYKKTLCSMPESEQLIVKHYLANQFLQDRPEKRATVEDVIFC